MRLCELRNPNGKEGGSRLGMVDGDMVFAVRGHRSMMELLTSGDGIESLKKDGEGRALKAASLSAPVPRPGKIVAAIVNTQAMLGGEDVTLDRPRLDMKAPSAVIGPGDRIRAPESGIRPEVELAAIVGRRISGASPGEAKSCLMGYTIINDVTAPKDSKDDAYEAYRRDKQSGEIKRTLMRGPLFRSKNHDTFCPMGPWIVTADEVGDLSDLKMETRFDGKLVQTGSTAEYIFKPEEIASYVSGFLSLEPGDVISCGSVGWAPEALGKLDPTEFVLTKKTGMLTLRIDKIGTLSNPIG